MRLFIFTFLIFSSVFVFAQVQLVVPKYSGEMSAVINTNKRLDAEKAAKELKEKQQSLMDQSLAEAITLRDRELSEIELSGVRDIEAAKDLKLSFPSQCNVVSVQLGKYPGILKDNWKLRVINSKGKVYGQDVKNVGLPEKEFVADLLKIRNLAINNSAVCFDKSYQAAVERYTKSIQGEARQAQFLSKLDEQTRSREMKRAASKSGVN